MLSISRKYRVGRGVRRRSEARQSKARQGRRQGAEIFTAGASSSEDTGHVVGRRHVCHASDLSRRATGVHEAPDTSDNNLSRSDSAGTMPPPRIVDPARYVIGCCSCCFSRRRGCVRVRVRVGPSFFPSSFRSLLSVFRPPLFFLAGVSPTCDTARFLPLHPVNPPPSPAPGPER